MRFEGTRGQPDATDTAVGRLLESAAARQETVEKAPPTQIERRRRIEAGPVESSRVERAQCGLGDRFRERLPQQPEHVHADRLPFHIAPIAQRTSQQPPSSSSSRRRRLPLRRRRVIGHGARIRKAALASVCRLRL